MEAKPQLLFGDKEKKQVEAVLGYCRGPEDEKRFAGLMLLTKVVGAREYLVSEEGVFA